MLKNIEQVKNALEDNVWTFAKSMARIPHEWSIKKKWKSAGLYEACFHYINKNGVTEYFYGRPYKYLYLGEYKYWTMTEDVNESYIINRAKI